MCPAQIWSKAENAIKVIWQDRACGSTSSQSTTECEEPLLSHRAELDHEGPDIPQSGLSSALAVQDLLPVQLREQTSHRSVDLLTVDNSLGTLVISSSPEITKELDRNILGVAHPRDVVLLHLLREDLLTVLVSDDVGPGSGNLEGVVGLLSHQTNTGDVAGRLPLKLTFLLRVLDDVLVGGGVLGKSSVVIIADRRHSSITEQSPASSFSVSCLSLQMIQLISEIIHVTSDKGSGYLLDGQQLLSSGDIFIKKLRCETDSPVDPLLHCSQITANSGDHLLAFIRIMRGFDVIHGVVLHPLEEILPVKSDPLQRLACFLSLLVLEQGHQV